MQPMQLQLPKLVVMKKISIILIMMFLGVQLASSKIIDNARVGYYVYENGECYAKKWPWAGKCVGVIISTTPNAEQLEMGYTHGIIVLLEDIPGLYQWWPENEEVAGIPSYSSISEDNAYAYTHNYLATRLEAAKACINYPKIGPDFSKCFIPTPSMWKLMLENVGLLTPRLMDDNTDIGRDARNTCAARLQYLIGGFKDDKYHYWLARQYGTYSAYFGYLCGINNGGYRDSYDGRGRYTLDGKPGYVGDRTQRRRLRAMCYF